MGIKGEKPMSNWDDRIFVGTAPQGQVKEECLTTEEMMEFAVYMREKKQALYYTKLTFYFTSQ